MASTPGSVRALGHLSGRQNVMTRVSKLRAQFLAQHHSGDILVMPNPFDVGSAKLLATVGAPALGTTSAGLAASRGQLDQSVGRDDLLAHVEAQRVG